MKNFLIRGDYPTIIRTEELDAITVESEISLEKAEIMAISKVKKYLLRKYDVEKIFLPIYEFDENKQFNEDDYVFDVDSNVYTIYRVLQSTQNNTITDAAYFKAEDPRDPTIVEYSIYFTLYILFGSIAKRNVPEDRFEQYNEAKAFFNDIKNDKITPGLPILLDESSGKTKSPGVRISSNRPLSHYY